MDNGFKNTQYPSDTASVRIGDPLVIRGGRVILNCFDRTRYFHKFSILNSSTKASRTLVSSRSAFAYEDKSSVVFKCLYSAKDIISFTSGKNMDLFDGTVQVRTALPPAVPARNQTLG